MPEDINDEFREIMEAQAVADLDEVDKLIQEIIEVERAFKHREGSRSRRRDQIERELHNFIRSTDS
ncbi:MAG TPA: hypothetical protein EYQ70_00950 [Marine Group III euryarchaeote]|jgi:hypothetical protein|uniref:Uncharacterized protein n=1 Tax=Marine Group III euryarchaeote TaxID=2173149 RepID=A0A7J4GSL0_9ARCH|nr:hypothetical protein [Marine Group III euryarchaeote]